MLPHSWICFCAVEVEDVRKIAPIIVFMCHLIALPRTRGAAAKPDSTNKSWRNWPSFHRPHGLFHRVDTFYYHGNQLFNFRVLISPCSLHRDRTRSQLKPSEPTASVLHHPPSLHRHPSLRRWNLPALAGSRFGRVHQMIPSWKSCCIMGCVQSGEFFIAHQQEHQMKTQCVLGLHGDSLKRGTGLQDQSLLRLQAF